MRECSHVLQIVLQFAQESAPPGLGQDLSDFWSSPLNRAFPLHLVKFLNSHVCFFNFLNLLLEQSQSYFSIHEKLTLGPPFCLCFVILILAAVICLMQIGPNDARSAYLV